MVTKQSVAKPNRKVISRAAARNAALVNQFATPGLGSLMARRWISGIGQLFVFVTGCVMIVMYLVQLDVHTYGEATGEFEPTPRAWLGKTGVILFAGGWLWALVTSLNLIKRARAEESSSPRTDSPPPENRAAEPPKLSE
jgi:hypothetical protein